MDLRNRCYLQKKPQSSSQKVVSDLNINHMSLVLNILKKIISSNKLNIFFQISRELRFRILPEIFEKEL